KTKPSTKPGGDGPAGGGEVFRGSLPPPATGPAATPLFAEDRLIHAVAVNPAGTLLATAGVDHTLKGWGPGTGRGRFTFRGHAVEVLDVAFSPDGKRVASAGWDNTVRLGDVTTGQEVQVFRGHTGVVARVAFARPKAPCLLSVGQDGTARVWDPAGDQAARTLQPSRAGHPRREHPGGFRALAVSPDGAWLAAAGADGRVHPWDGVAPRPPG